MSKKALLMILDGWGLGDQKKDDVIFNTPTPYWDYVIWPAVQQDNRLTVTRTDIDIADIQVAGLNLLNMIECTGIVRRANAG